VVVIGATLVVSALIISVVIALVVTWVVLLALAALIIIIRGLALVVPPATVVTADRWLASISLIFSVVVTTIGLR
jgi:hypothetical protein